MSSPWSFKASRPRSGAASNGSHHIAADHKVSNSRTGENLNRNALAFIKLA